MRSDITPGGVFPDYALPDHTGTTRTLSELQGRDPLILMLARGHYCPQEHQKHLDLATFQSKVAVAYTQMVTIATDEHHTLQEFRASVGAQWTFLSDPGRTVQKDLDIQEYTDPDHDPMIPHTLVLKPGLVVHSVYNGYWFWGRPSVDDLWRDLRAATSEIRPDWDLSRPGLREAFEPATRRLSMTGTPFRSDINPIPFVHYAPGSDGIPRSVADYTYGYGEAVADHVVRPVLFMAYSGEMTWRTSAGEEVAARLGVSDRMVRNYVVKAMAYCRARLDGLDSDQAAAAS